MANITETQILVDGPRNLIVKVVGILDTSDLGSTVAVDPTTAVPPTAKVRIDKVTYTVEDTLTLNCFWDATTPKLIYTLNGRGKICSWDQGGEQNNGGAGATGKILISTEGWATGKVLSFTAVFECVKSEKTTY